MGGNESRPARNKHTFSTHDILPVGRMYAREGRHGKRERVWWNDERGSVMRHRQLLQEIAHRSMLEHGLLPDFSPAALVELGRLAAAPTSMEQDVRDLRSLPWCSIDNDDSRDLDQLTVAEGMQGGQVRISVAVADVDSLVKKGSAIDEHARHNTTSVYTAAEIFPMLPDSFPRTSRR